MNPSTPLQPTIITEPGIDHGTDPPKNAAIGRKGAASRRNRRFHAHHQGAYGGGNSWLCGPSVLTEPVAWPESATNPRRTDGRVFTINSSGESANGWIPVRRNGRQSSTATAQTWPVWPGRDVTRARPSGVWMIAPFVTMFRRT